MLTYNGVVAKTCFFFIFIITCDASYGVSDMTFAGDTKENLYKWNVGALYNSFDNWKEDFNELKSELEDCSYLSDFKGKLSDPKELKNLLDLYFSFDREINKLYTYSHLRHKYRLRNR